MSLLAGVKFVKRATGQAEDQGKVRDKEGKIVAERGVGSGVQQDNEKRKRKHRRKDKDVGETYSVGDSTKSSSKATKKTKDGGRIQLDGQQHASKRQKPHENATGGTDWIEQALAVGDISNEEGTATAEELVKKAREEEIDLEVVKGLRDPKTRRRYGLFDPLKGEQEEDRASSREAGFPKGGGGLDDKAGSAKERGGLPATFAPRLLSGVGDKGAGWRAKALRRAREKAEKTGQSLEELVGERWGSLDQLKRESRGGEVGRSRRPVYRRGRDELASLAASEGRIAPVDSASLIGQVGKGGSGSPHESRRERGGERRLRIGRDARDTDVLKRFSSKLEDALGRHDDTRRERSHASRGRDGDGGDESGNSENDGMRGQGKDDSEMKEERRLGWREQAARAAGGASDNHGRGRKNADGGNRPGGAEVGDKALEARPGEVYRERSWDRERRLERNRGSHDTNRAGVRRDYRERPLLNGGGSAGDGRVADRRDNSRDAGMAKIGGNIYKGDGYSVERGISGSDVQRSKGERGDSRERKKSSSGSMRGRRGEGGTGPVGTPSDRRRNDGKPTEAVEGSHRRNRYDGDQTEAAAAPDGRDRAEVKGHGSDDGRIRRQPYAEVSVEGTVRSGRDGSTRDAGKEMEGRGVASDAGSGTGTGVEASSEANNVAPPITGRKLLTEAELTKLAVAAMKAKLKGDTATHARLTEEARLGREAMAAAAAHAAPAPAPPPPRWKPGLEPKETESNGGQGAGERGSRADGGGKGPGKRGEDEDVEVVTGFDENGRPMRMGKAELMREDLKSGWRKGKLKKPAGRWAGGSEESVAEFVKREREEGFEDMDETFVRNVSRLGGRFRGTELGGALGGQAGEDEEEEVDMRMFQRPEERLTAVAAAERRRARAVADHRRHSTATSRCRFCMESAMFKKHLILSLGEHTFLYLATGTRRLSDGHCYIVPMRHTPASTACDEDVWREIDLFKAGLRKMVAAASSGFPSSPPTTADAESDSDADKSESESERKSRKKHKKKLKKDKKEKTRSHKEASSRTGKARDGTGENDRAGEGGSGGGGDGAGGRGVIFLETGGKPGSSAAKHAFIEAVPVPRSAASDAPMYFRQALMEAGEEWSTHKKCIAADPRRGGVRRAVPKGFPYFHAEWENGGYAHVIEGEEAKFPRDFGVDTLAGVMGIDPPTFGGKGRGHSGGVRGAAGDEQERKMVMSFLENWKKFDWTSELDGGEYHKGATT